MSIWQRMKPARREWVLVFLASTLLLVWSSVPVWTGQALQTERLAFVGTFFDAPDYAVHIAMIRAGAEGAWRYELRFTTEPHHAYPIRMFYIVLGQANRLLRLDPEVLFQTARWVFGYTALFALYALMRRVFKDRRAIWMAFLLAAAGSGLGYLQLMLGVVPGAQPPVDLWLIDAYMLFSLALFPHFAFTLALMCAALALFLDFLEQGKATGTTWLLLPIAVLVQAVNPIAFLLVDIAMVAAAVCVWWRERRIDAKQAGLLALLAAAQIPLLLYNFSILTSDPVWRQYTLQNETLSPAPVYYLWGYGPFWPLAAVGSLRALRERQPALLGGLAWVIGAFLLAYAPFAIQRRFLLGITIPLAMLAATGLENIAHSLSEAAPWLRKRAPAVSAAMVGLVSMTSILFTPAYALYMRGRPAELFYPRSLVSAFAWIAQNTGEDDILLAAGETARLAAQKTGRRVYMGHPMETLYFDEKTRVVSAFFNGEGTGDWLGTQPIQWVIYGPYERELAPHFAPGPNLQPVFQEQDVEVFRVRR